MAQQSEWPEAWKRASAWSAIGISFRLSTKTAGCRRMGANPLMGGRFEMLQSYVQTPRQRETNFGKVVLKEVAGAFPKRDEFWDSCAQELDSSDLAFSVAAFL